MQQKSNQLIIHLFSLSLYQSPANRKKGGQALKIWKWQPSVFNHTASCICFLPLSDIDLVCEISVVSHTKVKPMWKNAPSVIRRLTEKEDIKRSVMFSKCNQFLSTGSKLSTTHCTKSHRGHQIHANPSLHHHVAGDGGQSAQRHIKHRLCTNTLPGHKAPPRVWWGGTSPLQTNRSKWAQSIRPSDFDLVLTHDVGPYVNSRACVSEGVGGVLWHYLPTAAVAVRTMSIISIQRVRPQSPQLCGHEEEKRNSSANELSLWSRPLAGLVFRARFLQQVTHNAENHRKPVNSLRGRSETYAAPFLPPPPPPCSPHWQAATSLPVNDNMTESKSLWLSSAPSTHEAWQTVSQPLIEFNLLIRNFTGKKRCDVCWRHAYGDDAAAHALLSAHIYMQTNIP